MLIYTLNFKEPRVGQTIYIFIPWVKSALHKIRPAARSTWTYAHTHRSQTSGLLPAASCLPLGVWPAASSELIANLVCARAHIRTDGGRRACEHTLPPSAHCLLAPAVLCLDSTICSSHLTGVGAAPALCLVSLLFALYSARG